ncbi:autotransporter domain-containing protein [Roseibium sp.]|uniref:autotransporter domain-containing protein n=1 Tax=Roseibium sp. TaxID=1936156 RepID=UPI003A975D4D
MSAKSFFRAGLLSGTALVGAAALVPAFSLADEIIDGTNETVIGTGGGTKGASWTVSGGLYVGDTATSTLTISQGGVVTSDSGIIGNISGSDGTVRINGGPSMWSNGSGITVGNHGTGTLILENGATTTISDFNVGAMSGSSGTVTVDGTGSRLTATNSFRMGQGGRASVTVENGGSLRSRFDTKIGYSSGVPASTLTVTGSGSSWRAYDDTSIGYSGSGKFILSDGAAAYFQNYLRIGENAFSNGTALVTGAGSSLSAGPYDMYVGNSGTGSLTIADGGSVDVSSGTGTLYVGRAIGSTGTLNIGADASKSAAASGSLSAASIAFGQGTTALVFNHTNSDYTFSQNMSIDTSGDLTIRNVSGTTSLTGTADFSGGNSAKMIADGGALKLTDGGTFSVNQVFVGDGAGSDGVLEVSGSTSSLTVGGDMTVGRNADGSITVSNGGKVDSTNSQIGRYAGSTGTALVTGSGSRWIDEYDLVVGESGTGTLTLADGASLDIGDDVFIGQNAGSTGTLNVGAGVGQAAAAAGTIGADSIKFGAGSGTLVFNHTNSAYDFDRKVSGSGTIALHAGTTKLSGDYSSFTGTAEMRGGTLDLTSSYTGAIDIYSGVLSVNGSANNAISVKSGGTLGGSGTVSNVTLASGSKIAPGNSIGTLNVSGNLGLVSGSVYQVEVDKNGNADRIAATGSITIDSGASLSVVAENGTDDGKTYGDRTDYTILTAGTLTGTFGTVTDNFAYLDASVAYTGTQATLKLERNDVNFSTLAKTVNQKGAASAVTSLGSGNALYNAVRSLPAGEPEQAFNALSGESHSTMQGAFMQGAGINRSTVNQRLMNVMGGAGSGGGGGQVAVAFHGDGEVPLLEQIGAQMWGRAYGGWAETAATSNTKGVTSYGGGFLVGFDAEIVPDWRIGVMAGYSRSQFDSPSNSSGGSADGYHLGAYAGTSWDLSGGALGLRVGTSYTLHSLDTARTVAFTGFSDRVTANYNASTSQAFAELGFAVGISSAVMEPFAGIALVNQHTDGFTETGGASALTSQSTDNLLGVTTVGVRAQTILGEVHGVTASLVGSLAWRHALGDVNPSSTMRFASGGDAFSVAGAPIDQNTASFEAGLSLQKDSAFDMEVTYLGEIGETSQDHSGRLGFRYRF